MEITIHISCNGCNQQYSQTSWWRRGFSLDFFVTQAICGACGCEDVIVGFDAKRVKEILTQ